jgi:hypothetical protein
MFVVPAATPVMVTVAPLPATIAMALFSDVHVKDTPSTSAGTGEAVAVTVLPSATDKVIGTIFISVRATFESSSFPHEERHRQITAAIPNKSFFVCILFIVSQKNIKVSVTRPAPD